MLKRTLSLLLLAMLLGAAGLPRIRPEYLDLGGYERADTIKQVLVALVCVLLVVLNSNVVALLKRTRPCLSWVLFGCFLALSSIAHHETSTFLVSIWCLAGIPLVYQGLLASVVAREMAGGLGAAMFLGSMPYLAASLLLVPVGGTTLYAGITTHPNNIGHFSIGVATALFAALLQTRRVAVRMAAVIGIWVMVALVAWSGSRTSAATLAGEAVAFVAAAYVLALRSRSRRGSLRMTVICLLLGTGLLVANADGIRETMERKSVMTTKRGDVLSGRQQLWRYGLDNISVLGGGAGLYTDSFGLSAHNSYLEIMGTHGILAGLAFTWFVLRQIVISFRVVVRLGERYSILLFASTAFAVLSMGENMWSGVGNTVSIAYFIASGITESCHRRMRAVSPTPQYLAITYAPGPIPARPSPLSGSYAERV